MTITRRLCRALAIAAVVGLTSSGGAGSAADEEEGSNFDTAVALPVMVLVFAFTVILAARFRED
ncbi:MAG: hypothetical protein ACJ732_02105 [Rubrobacteraceae bacterium]